MPNTAPPTPLGCLRQLPESEYRALVAELSEAFFMHYPAMRPLMPQNLHLTLPVALEYLLTNPDPTPLMAELARQHLAYGVDAEMLQTFGDLLLGRLHDLWLDCDYSAVLAAENTVRAALSAMGQTMAEAQDAETLSTWIAEVSEVDRRAPHIAVVRLETPEPPPYYPGQQLPVGPTRLPGSWAWLAPAVPYNDANYLEFHLLTSDDALGWRTVAPGDVWLLGRGAGPESLDPATDHVIICDPTGWAAVRCLISATAFLATPPRVHLFCYGEYPAELYDLREMWAVAAANPWLQVTPVTAHNENAWWLDSHAHAQPPRGLHLPQVGDVAEVVSSYGTWNDRAILIAGTKEFTQHCTRTLTARGTNPHAIRTITSSWL